VNLLAGGTWISSFHEIYWGTYRVFGKGINNCSFCSPARFRFRLLSCFDL